MTPNASHRISVVRIWMYFVLVMLQKAKGATITTNTVKANLERKQEIASTVHTRLLLDC